jgi:hypothetical protein
MDVEVEVAAVMGRSARSLTPEQVTGYLAGRRYGGDRWTPAYWSFEEPSSYSSWNSEVEASSITGSGTSHGG